MLKSLLKPIASLKLTVVLLALSLVLIYCGTWAMVDRGNFEVQKTYFHSFYVYVRFASLIPRPKLPQDQIRYGFFLPGGFTLGVALLVNLLAAHIVRFKFRLNRVGIILIHLGLIVLLAGEGISAGVRQERRLWVDVGESTNYVLDMQHVELAVIDTSRSDYDAVTVISDWRLRNGAVIKASETRLPFDIRIDNFYPNAALEGPFQARANKNVRATAGAGAKMQLSVVPHLAANGINDAIDFPTALITPVYHGQPLGTYLVSTFCEPQEPDIRNPLVPEQNVGDSPFRIALRFKRVYEPYTCRLLKFEHTLYPGTDTPRDFASTLRILDQDGNVIVDHRRIWMNHPLSFNGETYYQASFMPGDQTSVLEVVRNPSWVMPYIACSLTALGLLIHFVMVLSRFLGRQSARDRRAKASVRAGAVESNSFELRPRSRAGGIMSLVAVSVGIVYFVSLMLPPPKATFDLQDFGLLPISSGGRIQPIDSLARNSLRAISNYESFKPKDGPRQTATEWLLDVFARPEKADEQQIFRVDYPDIKSMLGADESREYFSYIELTTPGSHLFDRIEQAFNTESNQRDAKAFKLVELGEKIRIYQKLRNIGSQFLIPPSKPDGTWLTVEEAHKADDNKQSVSPVFDEFRYTLGGWRQQDPIAFNSAVAAWRTQIQTSLPGIASKVDFEHFYNRVDPFTNCMVFYVLVFVLAACSWLFWRRALGKTAFWLLVFTFAMHTLAITARIVISGRPPVTNLPASALFIGWGICALCIVFELIYRNGLAISSAAVLGATTLLIGQKLSIDPNQPDNMAVLQAVLDTNFWLATHVVCVTLGYATTFLAGFLGIVYLVLGLFTDALRDADRDSLVDDEPRLNHKTLAQMIYGVACFAIFFSFVGTVLGGLWADYSWGRFWGWDPKENGAVLVVLSNAILLHARWGGIVKERGVALLAIFGNIVTSWSWFGTNQLGIGLHSYGFMPSTLQWLLAFVGTQVLLIAVGLVPKRHWASFAETA